MKRVAVTVTALMGVALAYAFVQGRGGVDRQELARIVEALDVDPGEVVADVGAGYGRWAVALAKVVGKDGLVYATEVDPDDLTRIRERVERENVGNLRIIEGSQTGTGLPEACCDAILLRRVYHHFQDPEAMDASLRKALDSGGRLLVIDFETRARWRRPEGVPKSREGHGIDRTMVVSEMERAGFALVDEVKWANGDYALVFRASPSPP